MSAVFFVQVLAALRTQSLTVFTAKWFDGNFEQGEIMHQRVQVDVRIFRNEQPRFGDVILGKGIQFGKFPMQRLGILTETAHTFELGSAGKIPLNQQALGSAAYFCNPFHFRKRQTVFIRQFGNIKIKYAIVAGSGIDEKTDIQPQGFARIGHFVHFNGEIWGEPLNIVARANRQVNWFFA